MTGEVQNILKGSVVTTVEYDTGRRLIGVSTSNLIPGANGVAPLSKQGAFQVPEKSDTLETVDFVQAISNVQGQEDAIAETVDLPMLDQQPATLKEPVHSDVITENPVQVENPASMGSFDLPSIEMPIQPEQPVEDAAPVAIDIQMPQMTETIVADEPTGTNDQIFEGAEQPAPTSILETTPVAGIAVPEATETVPAIDNSAAPENIENVNPENVVAETPAPVSAEAAPAYEPPVVDIQLPVIEEKKDEDIMGSIPTTTPDTTIPTFNIDIPVISVPGEEAPVVVEDKTDEIVATPENPTIGQDIPQEQAPTPEVVEPTPLAEQTAPAVEEIPAVDIQPQASAEPMPETKTTPIEPSPEVIEPVPMAEVAEPEPTAEVSEKEQVPDVADENVNELPQEEAKEESKEAEGLREVIHQHRVIIENCATAIAKIAEELQKAAKSLEELEIKTAEITSEKAETTTKVEEIVQQGNSLINEAFDRINAISGPKL